MALEFDNPKNKSSIIKVIGVGGGGSNAVNHMYSKGIEGVDFIVCNTDEQALEMSIVPLKVQLGPSKTCGLGAGNKPEIGRDACIESIDEIKQLLSSNTKMLFITAGMGGGTGTGAAPEIARIAKEEGILTVGIVTTPFSFEGRKRVMQAKEGVTELRENVDTLVVISNDKLREIHGDLKLSDAFGKADDILAVAAKGIAEIITIPGYINVDFQDVNTVMKNGGVAIMGIGVAEGENRAIKAAQSAINSPLLNDNCIGGANNILINITSGTNEVTMDEIGMVTDYVQEISGHSSEIIWGNCQDSNLGDKISITVIATGFEDDAQNNISKNTNNTKIVHQLEEEQPQHTAQLNNENVSAGNEETAIPTFTTQEVIENEIEANVDLIEDEVIDNNFSISENENKVELFTPELEDEGEYFVNEEDELANEENKEAKTTYFLEEDKEVVADENSFAMESNEDIEAMVMADRDSLITNNSEAADNQIEFDFDEDEFQERMRKIDEAKAESLGGVDDINYYVKDSDNKNSAESIEEKQEEKKEDMNSIKKSIEVKKRLRNLSLKLSTPRNITEMEKEPAYKRRQVEFTDAVPSDESHHSNYSVSTDEEDQSGKLNTNNKYLHNPPD